MLRERQRPAWRRPGTLPLAALPDERWRFARLAVAPLPAPAVVAGWLQGRRQLGRRPGTLPLATLLDERRWSARPAVAPLPPPSATARVPFGVRLPLARAARSTLAAPATPLREPLQGPAPLGAWHGAPATP